MNIIKNFFVRFLFDPDNKSFCTICVPDNPLFDLAACRQIFIVNLNPGFRVSSPVPDNKAWI